MNSYMNTRELAKYLGINEKKVYSLIEEKGLPATKVTGKWGFFKELVDHWLENSVENHPSVLHKLKGFLMVAGSNDPLLDFSLGEMERSGSGLFPFFCNTGSTDGLSMLRDRKIHIAGSHILDEQAGEYNIPMVASLFAEFRTVVVNFAYRQQGLILKGGNPLKIKGVEDLVKAKVRYVNRQKGSGTCCDAIPIAGWCPMTMAASTCCLRDSACAATSAAWHSGAMFIVRRVGDRTRLR